MPAENPSRPIVDVHAHLTPRRFVEAVAGGRGWHGMSDDDGELWNPRNLWEPKQRIEEMDELRIDVQVISPTDCFYQYHQEASVAARIAAEVNEEIAETVRGNPDRFRGIGTLPMQDPDLAVSHARELVTGLGLTGVMIDDHVNGVLYDDPRFEELWTALEDLGAWILIHQYHPTIVTYRTEDYFLLNSIGNLVDRALTFSAFIYGGVIDRHPKLKVCLAHAGGYVPYALDRLDRGWEVWPEMRGQAARTPSSYIKSFYYDTVTFTDRNLRFMVDTMGADRVVLGSDWPAPMRVHDPVAFIESSDGLSESERDAILRGTVVGLLPPA
jgi:aminocarboxymuconate-semialdehyde decarboxylase